MCIPRTMCALLSHAGRSSHLCSYVQYKYCRFHVHVVEYCDVLNSYYSQLLVGALKSRGAARLGAARSGARTV